MNYEKRVMIQAFNILTKRDFKWTDEFSLEMRKQFLDLLLEYFTEIEHYEKCASYCEVTKTKFGDYE